MTQQQFIWHPIAQPKPASNEAPRPKHHDPRQHKWRQVETGRNWYACDCGLEGWRCGRSIKIKRGRTKR